MQYLVSLATYTVSLTYEAKTKSEGASAEDSGSYNFHRNRFPGTTIKIVNRAASSVNVHRA